MQGSSSSKSSVVEQPARLSFAENWRRGCRSFQVWARCDNGHFNEVLMAGWALAITCLMLAFAAINGFDSPEGLWYLCIGSFSMLLTGLLGIHMMGRWCRWENRP